MSVTARSSLLFLIVTLLLSVVPLESRSVPTESHCMDIGIIVQLLAKLCVQLDATLVHSLDGNAKDDNLRRLLSSEAGLHVARYCSPLFRGPDSLLLKKLKSVDVSDLADKLRRKRLCDKHVCEELVRTMFGEASDEVRLSDMEYIRREMCPGETRTTPTPPTPAQSQSNNNNTMAVPTSEGNMVPPSTEPPVPAVARAPTSASGSTKHAPATAPATALAPATSRGSKHMVASLLLFVLFVIGFRCIV